MGKIKREMGGKCLHGCNDPLVDEGIERCIRFGAKKIVMLPYFLFTGVLMERMEDMRSGYQEQYHE